MSWPEKTRVSVKTKKLRGTAVARGGSGTATRTVGLLGGILTYAIEAGILESNPAHGIRKPKDNVRKHRLSEAEYRTLDRYCEMLLSRSPPGQEPSSHLQPSRHLRPMTASGPKPDVTPGLPL
jgi:hypothetical protein